MVSDYTSKRLDKAKAEYDAAREALASAQSRFIEAERRQGEAMRAWEHEFFAPAVEKANKERRLGGRYK